MASFLKSQEAKNVMLSIVASVVAGTVTILIAGNYIARKASEATVERTMAIQNLNRPIQTEYIGNRNIDNIGKMGIGMKNTKPKLTVSITTSEFYNGNWTSVLTHTFYGESEEELANLINVHRTTDAFFRSSFTGNFDWKGSTIKLKNSEPMLLYA